MLQNIFNRLLYSKNNRTSKLKTEILLSFLIKGITIVISFIYVPLLLDYVDSIRYGIWLTLSSFIGWFNFFDFGLGNGFRNKLTEAFAKNDIKKAKEYTSTTYFVIGSVFLILSVILIISLNFIDWDKLLNIDVKYVRDVRIVLIILAIYLCLRFTLKLIGIVYVASQRPSINNLMVPLSNIIAFIWIFISSRSNNGSLIKLGLITSLSLVFVYAFFTIYAFTGTYASIRPSIKCIKLKDSKELITMGIKFFIIQTLGTLIYMTSNFLISHFVGPNEVTVYNIAYKYMSLPLMIVGIIVMPFWSAFTDAYVKKEYSWMKSIMRKLLIIISLVLFGIIIMIVLSSFVYKIWINNRVEIPFIITLLTGIFIATNIIEQPFSNLLNGIGKIRLSIIIVTIKFMIFFPLVYLTQKLELGVAGIILSGIIINMVSLVLSPIQVYKVLSLKANGIWDK